LLTIPKFSLSEKVRDRALVFKLTTVRNKKPVKLGWLKGKFCVNFVDKTKNCTKLTRLIINVK